MAIQCIPLTRRSAVRGVAIVAGLRTTFVKQGLDAAVVLEVA